MHGHCVQVTRLLRGVWSLCVCGNKPYVMLQVSAGCPTACSHKCTLIFLNMCSMKVLVQNIKMIKTSLTKDVEVIRSHSNLMQKAWLWYKVAAKHRFIRPPTLWPWSGRQTIPNLASFKMLWRWCVSYTVRYL